MMSPLVPMSRSICCTDGPMPREVEGMAPLTPPPLLSQLMTLSPSCVILRHQALLITDVMRETCESESFRHVT